MRQKQPHSLMILSSGEIISLESLLKDESVKFPNLIHTIAYDEASWEPLASSKSTRTNSRSSKTYTSWGV